MQYTAEDRGVKADEMWLNRKENLEMKMHGEFEENTQGVKDNAALLA